MENSPKKPWKDIRLIFPKCNQEVIGLPKVMLGVAS